ncbi:hypothetical protein INR49_015161 [Caranx melampygus]|nr:hypothetical protein INR49_015161 [Caranx melampygus]
MKTGKGLLRLGRQQKATDLQFKPLADPLPPPPRPPQPLYTGTGTVTSMIEDGELDYQLQDQDNVVFISTLHGG